MQSLLPVICIQSLVHIQSIKSSQFHSFIKSTDLNPVVIGTNHFCNRKKAVPWSAHIFNSFSVHPADLNSLPYQHHVPSRAFNLYVRNVK